MNFVVPIKLSIGIYNVLSHFYSPCEIVIFMTIDISTHLLDVPIDRLLLDDDYLYYSEHN